jgi:possible prophage lp2 protein 4
MVIRINSIEIDKFRGFEDFTMSLNPNITCIAGHNGVGKSTILAILSNCGEIKGYKTLNGQKFKGEFNRIIIGDKDFDDREESTIKFSFSGLIESGQTINEVSFRKTFQKSKKLKGYKLLKKSQRDKIAELYNAAQENETDLEKLPMSSLYYLTDKTESNTRFRLIPKKQPNVRDHEQKISWPTLYIGLSRLYPVGENEEKVEYKKLESTFDNLIITKHKEIMSSIDEYESLENTTISNLKSSTSIKTAQYPPTANSSGQDNLGQILTAVYSFEKLKFDMGTDYKGGLLVIDELDAALHPAAQNRLLKFLKEKSQELDLQVVFTTHSLSLLEYISEIRERDSKVTTYYLTKARGKVEHVENPTSRYLRNDLTQQMETVSLKRIPVLTEDSVARWYLEKIIEFYNNKKENVTIDIQRLNFIESEIGWSNISGLIKNDFSYYSNYIIVFDTDLNGDLGEQLKNNLKGSLFENPTRGNDTYFILPTISEYRNFNIERMMWEFLISLPADDEFYNTTFARETPVTKTIVEANGINSERYQHLEEKKKYKEWFKDYKYIIEELLPFYLNKNIQLIMDFGGRIERYYKNLVK